MQFKYIPAILRDLHTFTEVCWQLPVVGSTGSNTPGPAVHHTFELTADSTRPIAVGHLGRVTMVTRMQVETE